VKLMQKNNLTVTAINKNVRSSPRKLALVLNYIKGKKADLVIVKGDPSKTIEDLHNVHTIFKSGKLVKLNNEKMI